MVVIVMFEVVVGVMILVVGVMVGVMVGVGQQLARHIDRVQRRLPMLRFNAVLAK